MTRWILLPLPDGFRHENRRTGLVSRGHGHGRGIIIWWHHSAKARSTVLAASGLRRSRAPLNNARSDQGFENLSDQEAIQGSIRTLDVGHAEQTTPTASPQNCAATTDVHPEVRLDADIYNCLATPFGVISESEKDPLPYRTKPNYWDPIMPTMRPTWRRSLRPLVIASLIPPIRHTQG